MNLSKVTYFFEKTCLSCAVVGVKVLAIVVVAWMFYILTGPGI